MNQFISPAWVTTDVAVGFKNNLKLIGRFDRSWDDTWSNKPGGAKIGYTTQVRIEQKWIVNEGQALVQQPIFNQTVPLTINHQFQVGMGWSSADDALLVEEVQSRYTQVAGRKMANKWDVVAGAEVFKQVYFQIGAPNTPLSSLKTYTDAVAKLRNVAVPEDLYLVMDPGLQSQTLQLAQPIFNPTEKISKYFNTGHFSGPALGIDEWAWDPNVPTFVTGTFTSSTWLVSGANQTGSTLTVSGGGTYSLNIGDTFYIAGVNAINPDSFIDTGNPQAFSIQAAIAGSGGTPTFVITPPIIPPAAGGVATPLQTVTASPANNAQITFVGATGSVGATMAAQSSKQAILAHPAAFAFVMADLPAKLPGANAYRKNDKDTRISMRWAEQWNIQTDQEASRVDTIGGVGAILPYFALRIWT
jgi:P22 coat protein - gene protein 5